MIYDQNLFPLYCKAACSAGGTIVYDKRCGLSIMTIEAFVCLKGWNLANTKGHEAIREVELVEVKAQKCFKTQELFRSPS